VAELAEGVAWVQEDADRDELGAVGQERAVDRYEEAGVARRYLELYESVT
jgi:glycosyltransferase involved in cell wall biosynthesis